MKPKLSSGMVAPSSERPILGVLNIESSRLTKEKNIKKQCFSLLTITSKKHSEYFSNLDLGFNANVVLDSVISS